VGQSIFEERYPYDGAGSLANAQGTGLNTLVAPQTTVLRIDHLLVSNNDTIPHVIRINIGPNGGTTKLTSSSIPAGAGYNGAPAHDLFSDGLPATMDGLVLPIGWILALQLEVAMVAPFVVDCHALGGYV
jgi:hypothetical protein